MAKRECNQCKDAAKQSLVEAIKEGMVARGLWVPMDEDELLTAIFMAIDEGR